MAASMMFILPSVCVCVAFPDSRAWARPHAWLQYDCFEKHFMTNAQLQADIQQYLTRPDDLERKTKDRIRNARHGAFKSWKKSLLNNTALLLAILKNGLFDVEDMRAFMATFMEHVKKREDLHLAEKPADKATLKREAVKARKNLKWAMKQANEGISLDDLDEQGRKLLRQLETGELEALCYEKNQKYGYGAGVHRMPLSEAILFQI